MAAHLDLGPFCWVYGARRSRLDQFGLRRGTGAWARSLGLGVAICLAPMTHAGRASRMAIGMARYFFHSEDGHAFRDREGVELPDLDAAEREAIISLGEMIRDRAEDLQDHRPIRIIVTDRQQAVLFSVIAKVEDPPQGGKVMGATGAD